VAPLQETATGIVRHPRCTAVDWLTVGPIAPHADAIKQHFADGRYAPTTVASYLSDIAHFARWARDKRLRLRRIDEVSVTEFLDQHLPHCRREGSARHDRCDHRAALGHLLFVLRAQGVIALPAKSTTVAVTMRRRRRHPSATTLGAGAVDLGHLHIVASCT
jgi:integrase/recombinase XerC